MPSRSKLLFLCAATVAPVVLTSVSYADSAISGTVANATGAIVVLAGPTYKSTRVVSNAFSFPSVPAGSYTLAPRDANFIFTPNSLFKSMGTGAITGVNFTGTETSAPTFKIAGTLNGAFAVGTQITLNGANVGAVGIDSGGSYSFQNLAAGTYTISASLAGHAFSKSRTITITNTDSLQNSFTGIQTSSGDALTVSAVPSLPQATVGASYSTSILKGISGGTGPYHYQSGVYASGTPPIGMVVTATGLLTGTPKNAGTYHFTLCAADDHGGVSTVCAPTSLVVSATAAPVTSTPPVTTPPVTTPPVTTPPVASGTSWVYYNGVFDWPGDFTYAATETYADTSGDPLSGPHDIKVVSSAWGGWLPYALNFSFDARPYTKLTFSLKPTRSDQTWQVYFVKVGDVPVGISLNVAKYGPAPIAGHWATYTVPLSDLGVAGTSIYKFAIQDQTGANGNTWYVDNVGFEK
jgi:hypothetical protein